MKNILTIGLLFACLSAVACTTGQARSILQGARDAVGELADMPHVQPQDVIAMQVALDGASAITVDKDQHDVWIEAFANTANRVVDALEAHGVEVPGWISVAIKAAAALCHGICAIR